MTKLEFLRPAPENRAIFLTELQPQTEILLAGKLVLSQGLETKLGFNFSGDLASYANWAEAAATLLSRTAQCLRQEHQSATAPQQAVAALRCLTTWGESSIAFGIGQSLRRALPVYNYYPLERATLQEAWETAAAAALSSVYFYGELPHRQTLTPQDKQRIIARDVSTAAKMLQLDAAAAKTAFAVTKKREKDFLALAEAPDAIAANLIAAEKKPLTVDVKEALWQQLLAEDREALARLQFRQRKSAILTSTPPGEVVALAKDLNQLQTVLKRIAAGISTRTVADGDLARVSEGGNLRKMYLLATNYVCDRRRQSGQELVHLISHDLAQLLALGNTQDATVLAEKLGTTLETANFKVNLLSHFGFIDNYLGFMLERINAFSEIAAWQKAVTAAFPDNRETQMRFLAFYLAPYIETGISIEFLFSVLEDGLSGQFLAEIQATYAQFQELIFPPEKKPQANGRRLVGLLILAGLIALLLQRSGTENLSQSGPVPAPTPTPTPTPTPRTLYVPSEDGTGIPLYRQTPSLTATPTPESSSTTPLAPKARTAVPTEVSTTARPLVLVTPFPGETPEALLEEDKGLDAFVDEYWQESKESLTREFQTVSQDLEEAAKTAREYSQTPEGRRQNNLLIYLLAALVMAALRRKTKHIYTDKLFAVSEALFPDAAKADPFAIEFLYLMSQVAERPRGHSLFWDAVILTLFPINHLSFSWEILSEAKSIHRLDQALKKAGGPKQLEGAWVKSGYRPSELISQNLGFDAKMVAQAHLGTVLQLQARRILEEVEAAVDTMGLDYFLADDVVSSIKYPFRWKPYNPGDFTFLPNITGERYLAMVWKRLAEQYHTQKILRNSGLVRKIFPQLVSLPILTEDPNAFAQKTLSQLALPHVLSRVYTLTHEHDSVWRRLGLALFRPRNKIMFFRDPKTGRIAKASYHQVLRYLYAFVD